MVETQINLFPIFTLYVFIIFKYIVIDSGIFNIQFLLSTLMVLLLGTINTVPEKFSQESKDVGKFMGHVFFLSICFSMFSWLVSLVYGMIFYFGFVNTVIFLNIAMMMVVSGTVQLFGDKIINVLSKTWFGSKILDLINYFYNFNIFSKFFYNYVAKYVSIFFKQYLFYWFKIILAYFMVTNYELGDNSRSNIVKNKMSMKCSEAKNKFIEKIAKPYFIKSIESKLSMDPFAQTTNQYKDTLSTNNMEMSLLTSTNGDNGVFDDLDVEVEDVDVDAANAAMQMPDITATNGKLEFGTSGLQDILTGQEPTFIPQTSDNKAALRKKLAAKKAQRTGSMSRNTKNQKVNTNLGNAKLHMEMPPMNELIQTMLKGDNLEKMMKQIPPEKMNLQMPNVDPEQMKQLLQSMMKNN